MRRLLSIEFRKNRKSVFLYLAVAVSLLFQFVGLLGEEYTGLAGRYVIPVIGTNLFTTHLLLEAILSYLIVKDFEAGIIKEYLFVGYTRKEIFIVKSLYLFIESSVIMFFITSGMLLWKILKNGYGAKITGSEVAFLVKMMAGNVAACFFLCAIAVLCVIVTGNALAMVLYFLLVGSWDMAALFLKEKLGVSPWISVRYLVSCFYDGALTAKEYFCSVVILLAGGLLFYMIGLAIFKRREYR